MRKMTREEMLAMLSTLSFNLIWPENWDDIGFTEREIWINSKGYGYIMCDEPTQCWDGHGLGTEKWQDIKTKIQNNSLTHADIEETCLEDFLKTIYFWDDCYFENQDELCAALSDLAETNYPENYFYAMETVNGTLFFDSEEAFKSAYEKDWADKYWEDMDDDLLAEWVHRLFPNNDGKR